jgi:hypothetical protein
VSARPVNVFSAIVGVHIRYAESKCETDSCRT